MPKLRRLSGDDVIRISLGVLLLVFLSACAPSTSPLLSSPTRRGDRGEVTATLTPTATATAIPTATATTTPTPLPTSTPTRTLSPAESRAARLPALANLTWHADGDKIILGDNLATLDPQSGGLRWDSQKNFAALNPYLTQNKAALANWMNNLKAQGIQFITFPDSQGRKEIPPYIVIASPDGKVQMLSAKKGTADFVFKDGKITGVFPDDSSYYFVNPDGSFDMAPLQEQAKAIAQSLRDRGVIQHPDPAKADFIQKAVEQAIMINPYGATAKEINDFIKSRTGKDFAEHFNRTWGDKLGLDYYKLMDLVLAQSPQDLFTLVKYIGNVQDPRCKSTCAVVDTDWRGTIQIVEGDHFPLHIVILKETYGNTIMIKGVKILKYPSEYRSNPAILSHSAEAISLAIEAYVEYLQNQPDTDVNFLIDWAFKGGIVR